MIILYNQISPERNALVAVISKERAAACFVDAEIIKWAGVVKTAKVPQQ